MNPKNAVRSAYDVWHRALAWGGDASPWHEMILGRLSAERDLDHRVALEIGTGRGEFALRLESASSGSCRLVAADFSLSAVARGSSEAAGRGKRVSWLQADILRIPLRTDSVDTVFSCETIEHTTSPVSAVRELIRVLRPGGRIFLSFPNYLNLLTPYRAYLRLTGRRFREEGQPINRLLLYPRVARWVRKAGARIETVDGRRHVIPLAPGRAAKVVDREGIPRAFRYFASQMLIVARKHSRVAECGS